MEYRITNTRQDGEMLYTTVEYTIEGQIVEVDIPHFQPTCKGDVITGIENRYESELRKLEAAARIQSILEELNNAE